MNTKKADYRKLNDHTLNSSKYHKKDGSSVRSILKAETKKLIQEQLLDPEEGRVPVALD